MLCVGPAGEGALPHHLVISVHQTTVGVNQSKLSDHKNSTAVLIFCLNGDHSE